jgi:DNA-binding transcriptional LysR family regulator
VRIDPRLLEPFVVLADELHFGRASARLNLAQPSLSQQISWFERQLGVALFKRTSRGVSLTAAGESVLSYASESLRQMDLMARAAAAHAGRRADPLRIAAAHDAATLAGAPVLRAAAPEPTIDVRFSLTSDDDAVDDLLAARADAALVWSPRLPPACKALPIASYQLVAVMSDDHPRARSDTISARDVAPLPLVLFDHSAATGIYEQLLAGVRAGADDPLDVIEASIVTSGQAAMLDRVRSGDSFTVVTRELYDAHAGDGLAAIPLEPPIEITAILIWRSNDTNDVLQQLIARLDHSTTHATAQPPAAAASWSSGALI